MAVSWVGTTVLLYVDDEGPGIPPDYRDRVFDRFWRGTSRGASGSGLGLAIAAWIVDRHEGSIRVTDAEAAGARFEVRKSRRCSPCRWSMLRRMERSWNVWSPCST
jgi:signal transduction histidine kinase